MSENNVEGTVVRMKVNVTPAVAKWLTAAAAIRGDLDAQISKVMEELEARARDDARAMAKGLAGKICDLSRSISKRTGCSFCTSPSTMKTLAGWVEDLRQELDEAGLLIEEDFYDE